MPSLTQIPTTVSSPATWTATGTGDPGCVQSNDGDTTYLNSTAQNATHAHLCTPAIPASAVSPVNSAIMGVVCRGNGDTGGGYYGVNGGSTISTYNNSGTYTDTHGNWPSLAISGIDGVGTRVTTAGSGTINIRCTYIYRTIDYTIQAGGFSVFFSALLPLVGAGLTWAQFRAAVRLVSRHTTFRESELRQFWRELVAYRHPRFFDLGMAR